MNSLTDKEINRASDGIDKALSTATRSNRGEVAFRILSVVRNLNDHIAFKIWKDVRPDQKMDINKVASKFGNVRPYQFVARFDHFLRASVSHFTPSEEGAERLMIKYYRYLLQLKKAVYDRYGMIILRNVDMFLEDLDEQTKDYYQKVATEIEKRLRIPPPKNSDNYYIDKIKPFFVNQEIYYEVALEPADEKPNKFNRITAFTKYDISTDYCVALSFSDASISVFNTDFPIKIITEWHVSIRPCELNNFAELLNVECSVSRGLNEYKMVMSYLEQNGATLVDIIDYDQREYDSIKNWVIASTQKRHSYIFDMLDICREISANKRDGANIIRYLLCRMNNRIIKDQQAHGDEKRYAGLNISSKCMPFDRNPYSFNPKGHISNLYDLFECIDTAGHQGELLARYIEKNTNQNGVLFTPIDQLTMFGMPQEIEQTIEKYNRSLYSGFRPASELGVFKDYVYSKGCEIATVQIINKLEELADNVPAISSSFSEEMISQLMLFLQSAIDKMDDNFGRAAIVENGSPMFNGQTASGESQIRRWMLESDLIEAIIALPTDLFYNTGIATYIWVLSKNKRPERKGKIQLIDASTFFKKLRKALGDKKNEISPEDRSAVTKLYADFAENEYCKIYRNEEFIYREYTVMQPLQRSYAITEERIQVMVSKGALDSLYNEVKFADLELMEERDGKAQKQLNKFFVGKPIYDAILADLNHAISDTVWMSPDAFMPHLTEVLSKATTDKKLLEKIADGLSVMDKNAEIQRDRKGNVIYDKETKDTELVKWEESIEDYMAREVLPHIPDAAAFFEENLGAKKPVIKTGAEIPFTRYFYKYQQPIASEELEAKFSELELSVSERVAQLFE